MVRTKNKSPNNIFKRRPLSKTSFLLMASMALTLVFSFLSINTAYAYSNPDFFLKQGIGARQLGMGNTGTAVADDASAVFFNPAGLAYLKNFELTSMHSEVKDYELKLDYMNLVIPVIHGRVLAVSGAILKTDQIPITKDIIPNIVNYAEDKEQVAMVSYGHRISNHAAFGLTVKDIRQTLYNREAKGNEADFGLLYKPSKAISFGLNIQDALPSEIKWDTGVSDDIPYTIRGGIAVRMHDWGSLLTLDVDKVKERDIKYNGGWEYQFNETLIGRVGINDGSGTAGFSLVRGGWRFDYAYMKGDLGDMQRFSGTARFGSYLFENLWRKYKRPQTPQCGVMQIQNNAKCDKLAIVNGQNPNSRISSYPLASARSNAQAAQSDCVECNSKSGSSSSHSSHSGSRSQSQNVKMAGGVMTPQPDINKVLAKDDSPIVQVPRAAGAKMPDEKIREGNKLVLAGRYDEAVKAYREALNMKPNLEEAHVKLAGIYQYQKLYGEAIEEYKDAIAINPVNPDNYISISSLYAKIGEFDKAQEACEIVVRMAPGTTKAKIAQNLYETFKRQAAPKDDKMVLKAANIQELNFEESNNAGTLNIDSSDDDQPIKKSTSKSKKSSSKSGKKKSSSSSSKKTASTAKSTKTDSGNTELKNLLD
ncbi:MAG: PorV/PorQ family protein [Candidatus Wallbacteria bacterium]